MSVCKECSRENELDQWFEAPRLKHLVCPRCAGGIEYARPITTEQLVNRILGMRENMEALLKENTELRRLTEDSPDLGKQLRRLTRAAERSAQANEQIAHMLTELTNNLSPRWALETHEVEQPQVKKLLERLVTEAGPGAILQVTEEEMSILQSIHRL